MFSEAAACCKGLCAKAASNKPALFHGMAKLPTTKNNHNTRYQTTRLRSMKSKLGG